MEGDVTDKRFISEEDAKARAAEYMVAATQAQMFIDLRSYLAASASDEARRLLVSLDEFLGEGYTGRVIALQRMFAEDLVRFCPACGSVGEVPSEYRDCCPDGSIARMVPQKFAEVCRGTFKMAVASVGHEPDAYLHTMHMEFEQKQEALSFDEECAFGRPGEDYSAEYEVTVEPLFRGVRDAK